MLPGAQVSFKAIRGKFLFVTASCPWSFLEPTLPAFCEAPLCSWVREPGNTWSNLGFLVVGWLIWRRTTASPLRPARVLSFAAFTTGLGSAFFHASGSKVGGLLDYGGMFLITGAMTALNVRRWLGSATPGVGPVFVGVAGGLLAAVYFFPEQARWIFVLGAPCCAIELALLARGREHARYRDYWLAWGIVAAAALAWWLDSFDAFCVPDNHVLSLHGVWHLLMAAALWVLSRFYAQFDLRGTDVH